MHAYLHFPSISWFPNYGGPKVPRLKGRGYPVSSGRMALDNVASSGARHASELPPRWSAAQARIRVTQKSLSQLQVLLGTLITVQGS